MTVTVVIELPAQPESVEYVKSFIRSIAPDARNFDGFENLTMHQDQDDPNHLVLLEWWHSRGHHEKYLAWRTERGDFAKVVGMLTGPPSITYFDGVEI